MAKLTPMMQQYMDVKEKYKDCLLFFRLGDFYEMFFDDAVLASKELEITLTGRDCGLGERAPMCGVPFHSAHTYISRLINKGYKVAICEQVEDPSQAKGIVKREVVKVVTPGTITDISMLEDKKNNYLMCIYNQSMYYGISVVDVSTGEFLTTQINWGNTEKKLVDEISRFKPSEIIVNCRLAENKNFTSFIEERFGIYITLYDNFSCNANDAIEVLQSIDNNSVNTEKELSTISAAALLSYLNETQKVGLSHIQTLEWYEIEEYMNLDLAARRNLELTETMREKKKKGSLLWVLDKTMTAMGGRKLRKWIEQPLINTADIQIRLDSVEELKNAFMVRSELRELLSSVYDIERLTSKIVLGSANARDLIALRNSLCQLPYIKNIFNNSESRLNKEILNKLDEMQDVYDLIESSIIEEPPITIKEGKIIKNGYNEDVDKYRNASTQGKQWIAELEARERKTTKIKNLKIKYNRVFGYYIEVTKSYFDLVPDHYIRKQTLANGERYIIDELKELEDTILGAEEKVVQLEYELFIDIRNKISNEVKRLKTTAECIAEIDVLCSLAEVADRESYCKPEINDKLLIDIKEGRHPVVEKVLNETSFIPNSTLLDDNENRLVIITGPNMAGKSTFMRQTALIVLMAQIGSFVPASSAVIGVVDKIFTRVGASDDLASGQSTFMVEMNEVANILENATSKSLLILDEIGRGTSTFDGLSIAWSVIEYINDTGRLGSRTLFATHYHELTELENKLNGIKNYCLQVKKKGDNITFERKIIKGGADESYGIEVAKLAGVPQLVIDRAKAILNDLDSSDIVKGKKAKHKDKKPVDGQIDLISFNSLSKSEREVIDELRGLDATNLTPLDAINKLYSLQQKLK